MNKYLLQKISVSIILLWLSLSTVKGFGQSGEHWLTASLKAGRTSVVDRAESVHRLLKGFQKSGDFDSLRFYSEKYLSITRQVKNEAETIEALYLNALGEYRFDLDAFVRVSRELEQRSDKADNHVMGARARKLISDYYYRIGDADSSIIFLKKAEQKALQDPGFAQDSVLKLLVGQFRHNIASRLYQQQRFDESLEVAMKNRHYAIDIGDKELETRSYQVLATIYSALVSYAEETDSELDIIEYSKRSKEYAKLFISAASEMGNDYLTGFAHATLANMFYQEEAFDSALVHFTLSLDFAEKRKDYLLYCSRLGNVANVLHTMGRLEDAGEKYYEAYPMAQDIGSEVMQARMANNLSYNSLKLNDLNRARDFAKRTIELGLKLERYGTVSQGYGNLSGIEEQAGNFEEALAAFKYHEQYRDSVLKEENLNRIEELQTQYETEKKEAEIELLQNKSELQQALIATRNSQFIAVAVILILILVSVYFWYHKRLAEKQQALQDSNQRLLSVQMNPHFLFNALVSIQSFILQQRETKETSNFVAKFAKVTRMVLSYSRERFVTLQQELTLLEEFLKLQQIRTNHKFDYIFNVDTTIQADRLMLPPMLAQPFIENAIEHGILPKQDHRGSIQITIKNNTDLLCIEVEDNGAGLTQEVSQKSGHESLATKITTERFGLLAKITDKPFSYEIINKKDAGLGEGVIVRFTVPRFEKAD